MSASTGSLLHNAPRVSYPVGRSPFYALLLGVTWAAGALATLAWCWHADAIGAWQLVAAGWLIVAALLAGWSWRHTLQGVLTWDGQQWSFEGNGAPAAVNIVVACHLDVQAHMLLSLHGQAASSLGWAWLARSKSPARWLDLRRALFAGRREHADQPNLGTLA